MYVQTMFVCPTSGGSMSVYICTYNVCLSVCPMSGGFYVWPSLAEVNTRARRYVSAWLKYQKREESKQVHLIRVSTGNSVVMQSLIGLGVGGGGGRVCVLMLISDQGKS